MKYSQNYSRENFRYKWPFEDNNVFNSQQNPPKKQHLQPQPNGLSGESEYLAMFQPQVGFGF